MTHNKYNGWDYDPAEKSEEKEKNMERLQKMQRKQNGNIIKTRRRKKCKIETLKGH